MDSPRSRGASADDYSNPHKTTSKSRGRPKMETRPEDPEDRRRAQIRIAQRAYRMRKEETLRALRDKCTKLEAAITDIASAWGALNDELRRTQALRARPDLARQLQDTHASIQIALREVEQSREVELREEAALAAGGQRSVAQSEFARGLQQRDEKFADDMRSIEVWGYRVVRES